MRVTRFYLNFNVNITKTSHHSHRFVVALIRVFVIATVVCTASQALCTAPADSIKHVRLPKVDITSERLLTGVSRDLAPTSIISRAQLQTLGARQIADALSFVPGVFVRNYGGLGGLKTISLRGANAAQTLILVDGVRLNSTQNGQFDLSTLPISMIEEIEVVRGGAAAMLGAGAMGGVVNIRTKRSSKATFLLKSDIASFGETGFYAQGSVPLSSSTGSTMILSANVEYQHTQGNFPFAFNEFGNTTTQERSNGDFLTLSGRVQAAGKLEGWQFNAQTLVRRTERGTPGAVVQGSVEMARARLDEGDALASITASKALSEASALSLLASWRGNTLRYRDPDARTHGLQGIDETFHSNDAAVKATMRFMGNIDYEWQAETVFSDVHGNMFQPEIGNYVRRVNASLAGKMSFAENSLTENGMANNSWKADIGLRGDWFSDFGLVVSPLVSAAWLPNEALTVRGQWSYNFRPPSFNELYYLNFGNVNLLPERSHAWNVGCSALIIRHSSLMIRAEVDGFLHLTHNQIVAVPSSPVTWSARNIGDVRTFGLESSVTAGLWDNTLSAQLSATLQRATDETDGSFSRGKLLVYTPSQLASGILTYSPGILKMGITAQYSGVRYTLPANTDESLLPAFTTVNIFLEASPEIGSLNPRFRLHCDNLFDERYAVIRNYPMPGRALRLTVEVRSHD